MLNKLMVIGYLGNDPELRYTTTGQSICTFSIATTEKWKDKDGNKQERTDWFRCNAWGKLGEIIKQYAKKGSLMYVCGSARLNEYEDKDGNKRASMEININEFKFLSKAESTEGGEPSMF